MALLELDKEEAPTQSSMATQDLLHFTKEHEETQALADREAKVRKVKDEFAKIQSEEISDDDLERTGDSDWDKASNRSVPAGLDTADDESHYQMSGGSGLSGAVSLAVLVVVWPG